MGKTVRRKGITNWVPTARQNVSEQKVERWNHGDQPPGSFSPPAPVRKRREHQYRNAMNREMKEIVKAGGDCDFLMHDRPKSAGWDWR